jgi:hypothetical protein
VNASFVSKQLPRSLQYEENFPSFFWLFARVFTKVFQVLHNGLIRMILKLQLSGHYEVPLLMISQFSQFSRFGLFRLPNLNSLV